MLNSALPSGAGVAALSLILVRSLLGAEVSSTYLAPNAPPPPTITNLLQARQIGLQNPGNAYPMELEGQVCWVSPTGKAFALVDSTGGLILQMEAPGQPARVGQRLRLTGMGTLLKAGDVYRIGVDGLELDDDGLHPATERTGTIFLKAGRVPIRLGWFNGRGPFALEVTFEGPGIPRRRIRNSELFRSVGETNWVNGLDYRCYEGWWTALPDFADLKPTKTGTITNIDLGLRPRAEGVGLEFAGYLEVPRDGVYTFYLNSDDGSRLSLGELNVRMQCVGQDPLPMPRRLFIGQILSETEDGSWSQVEGKVTRIAPGQDGWRMELSVGRASLSVMVADAAVGPAAGLMNRLVRATGFCQGASSPDGVMVPDRLLVPDRRLIEIVAPSATAANPGTNASALPLLTTAVAVHQLKREAAQLKYLAKVRGVVTCVDPGPPGFALQDSTGGLYVQGANPVRLGDFVEVEGTTDPGYFAPMLIPARITPLGRGRLPEPIRPAWDQLMNGSMDAQYVELEGIVTTVAAPGVRLLTHGGTITVMLRSGLDLMDLEHYENKLVRIRGVLLANWDAQTHQVKLGEFRLFDPEVKLENSAPVDLESIPEKTPAELLQFDPHASLFQRIRMSGQVVHISDRLYFMMARGKGVRFVASKPEGLQVGDTVEVAGYPELGGPSPLLHEASVRRIGHAALLPPTPLSPDNLISTEWDATRVRVEGVLTGLREFGPDQVLEMQNGAQSFVALLNGEQASLNSLPLGCRLLLTGVYAVQGDNQVLNQRIASFALLLDSPTDIVVLARPPWWTLRRLLAMVGALGGVLVVALLWITQLRRKIDERTVQLEEQIQRRERIEQHRAMEQERARVAQDLHDELGSGLTEISMLATLPAASPDARRHLVDIGGRARQMVTALDEIVWAMNPRHDSLESLASYLCLYADRFLKLANIACRLKGTLELPDRSLNPIHRHQFFLAFKEALTNVVRHSGATEVRLSIRVIGDRLRLSLADNGGGIAPSPAKVGMDGLANMRARLEKIGGRFTIASQAGRGTTLRFYLPLN